MNIDGHLPLIELHRHLCGNIRLSTILDLAGRHHIPLPAADEEGLRPYVQVSIAQPGVMAFISRIQFAVSVLADAEACRRAAYENVQDAAAEGIDYLELRFSPWFMAEAFSLDPAAVTAAVCEGVKEAARQTGITANLIGILSRTYGVETARKELDALLTCRDSITAIDLAGDEINYPAPLFKEHFARARAAGWRVTVHAGESCGAESIWQAIEELGAERIGHAVHAVDDPHLMEFVKEKRIGIECNLTSNVQTSTVNDYPAHPLKRFLENELLATINSDDPRISGIDLRYEYEVAAPAAGLSLAQIRQAQANALEVAFLPAAEKEALRNKKKPLS